MAVTLTTGDGWAGEHTNIGTITLAGFGDATRIAVVAHEPDLSAVESPDAAARERLSDILIAFARQIRAQARLDDGRATTMSVPPPSGRGSDLSEDRGGSSGLIPDTPKNEGKTLFSASVTLRVTEARVDDVGHAMARLAAADLVRIGARPGDVLQITGRLVAVARAELQAAGERGTIQIDGTVRGNCGAGLQEIVSVTRVEHGTAVSVRLASVGGGSAQTAISPERMLEDLVGVPVVTGAIVRVPTFAKAVNFQVVRTIPVRAGRHRSAHRSAGRRRRSSRRRRLRAFPTKTSAASSASWRACARSSSCRSRTSASSSVSASCRRRACCCTGRPGPARRSWPARSRPRAGSTSST